ncbi:MAG: hypothetical protein ABI472_18870 [Ginsengibacter sp.]
MKKIIRNIASLIVLLVVFNACKKNYITGGVPGDVNMYKNTSTYDVLKADPLYDTLVQLIDAAGLKDKINDQGTTFFAPSDYSIYNYLNERTVFVQNNIDVNGKFALDSLLYYMQTNKDNTRDSLLMYLVHTPLPYSVLTNTGALYPTELMGDTAIISYEYTKDGSLGYNPLVSSQPRIVYYTHLWYHYDLSDASPAGDVPDNIGVRTLIKTSGIATQNGYINALTNNHTLLFYGTKQ